MTFRQALMLSFALLLGAVGCSSADEQPAALEEFVGAEAESIDPSGADDESAPVRSTVVGHAEAIDGPSAAEVTPALVRLWTSVGASRPLAECYADMLEDTGLSAGIQDLNDLAAAQAKFTPDQAAAFGACGTGS